MTKDGMDRREAMSTMLALAGGLAAACASDGEGSEETASVLLAENLSDKQKATAYNLCEKFWNMDNVLKIEITMMNTLSEDGDDWAMLRDQLPAGGACGYEIPYLTDRYTQFKALSVKITATGPNPCPAHATTITTRSTANGPIGIGIIKKSWCGSRSEIVPCLKLDFGEFNDSEAETEIQNLIGTTRLTLNNCRQDSSYIKQPLGNYLFKAAGVPYSRCNFCEVWVNGVFVGLFVNMEPVHRRYLDNNFGTFTKTGGIVTSIKRNEGNLYEIYAGLDLAVTHYSWMVDDKGNALNSLNYMPPEGCSKFDASSAYASADFVVAAAELANTTDRVTHMKKVIDVPAFIKCLAMNFMLRNFDGYPHNLNNAYFYNDVAAVMNPIAPTNVRFKVLPWGIDNILNPYQDFIIPDVTILGSIVRNDPTQLAALRTQVKYYLDNIFTRAKLDAGGEIANFIDKMQAILTARFQDPLLAGKIQDPAENRLPRIRDLASVIECINEVRRQLKLTRSGAFMFVGLPASTSVYVLDYQSGDCLHPSSADLIGGSTTDYEVFHQPPSNSAADRWYFQPSDVAEFRLVNEQYTTHPYLHCSTSLRTPAPENYLRIYTTPNLDGVHAKDFTAYYAHENSFKFRGTFTLSSYRTSRYLLFGSELTPSGRKRVYQFPTQGTELFWY